jgi:hypothetical protein
MLLGRVFEDHETTELLADSHDYLQQHRATTNAIAKGTFLVFLETHCC